MATLTHCFRKEKVKSPPGDSLGLIAPASCAFTSAGGAEACARAALPWVSAVGDRGERLVGVRRGHRCAGFCVETCAGSGRCDRSRLAYAAVSDASSYVRPRSVVRVVRPRGTPRPRITQPFQRASYIDVCLKSPLPLTLWPHFLLRAMRGLQTRAAKIVFDIPTHAIVSRRSIGRTW